jgi:hypothetical protein
MKKRRIFTAVLVFILCFSCVIPAVANPYLTTGEKADALNRLDILKGDNGDYKLGDSLLRSEAAAFIVRVMGKENHVLLNKEDYWGTRFPDVISSRWYAPYVGYCLQQGIISGEADGYYRPNSTISEKAFLKLVLGALGYVYNTDFTWDEVYMKSYYVGLVDDQDYLDRTEDNLAYKRGDVVDVLYNAMTKVIKDTETTLIESLVNDGVISRDTALYTGLLDDGYTSPPASGHISVEQLIVLNQNGIFIRFSEEVEEIDAEDIVIYETDDFTRKLDVTIRSRQPDTLVLKTSNQEAYTDYTLEISNVRDGEDVFSGTVSDTFTGYKASEVKSEFFRVAKVEPVSSSMVNVYFTHPININSEKASYYDILEDDEVFASGSTYTLTAGLNGAVNNSVTIFLKGKTFTEGVQYTLKVGGDLTSIYGVKLNEGDGDSMRFRGTAVEVTGEEFKLAGISTLDYKTLQLEFNKELHPTRAQQIFSYYITDSNGSPVEISKAALTGQGIKSGKIVHLSIKGAFGKKLNYKIMINEVNDVTRRHSIIEKEYSFTANYSDTSSLLNIQSAKAVDSGTIEVYFNKALDEASALTKEYYTINGVTHTGYSALPAKVYFDAGSDNRKVKLFLPANKTLLSGKTYKLTVISAMKDYLGNMAMANRESVFSGSSTASAKPYISDAVIISKDTIKVTFSKEIAVEAPNIVASNYYLEYDDGGTVVTKVPLIAGYIDSKTIVLKFDTLDFEKEYTLKFNSLKDYSGLYIRTSADGQNYIKVRLGN